MVGFHDVRFPEDIAYGASGGPEFLTDIVTTSGGHEQRNIAWSESRAVYNVTHGIKTKEQLDSLLSFFRARKGRAYGFRLKDWADYQLNEEIIAIGDGAMVNFQTIKAYRSGDYLSTRVITKPVVGTIHVFLDGVEQVSGVSTDMGTGVVTFVTPPSEGVEISITAEFDVPVRFDSDAFSARLDANGSYSWDNITLVEIRG